MAIRGVVGLSIYNVFVTTVLLAIFVTTHNNTQPFCYPYLGVGLITLTVVLLAVTIGAAVLVTRKLFKIAFFFTFLKLLLLVGIGGLIVYVSIATNNGNVPKNWVDEKNWVGQLQNSNICHKGGQKFTECCVKPQQCTLVGNSFSLDCSVWSPNIDALCYSCKACTDAIYQKLYAEWTSLKSLLPVFCFVLSCVLFGVEFVYHVWYQYKVLQQQQHVAQQHVVQQLQLQRRRRQA